MQDIIIFRNTELDNNEGGAPLPQQTHVAFLCVSILDYYDYNIDGIAS